jgi:hypothetical protein
MTEKVAIRDFGPIRRAEMDVKDLTVFVGPQATGKSLAAQVLYFMRGLESLASRPVGTFLGRKRNGFAGEEAQAMGDADSPRQNILSGLEWWLGNESSVYVTFQTALSWNPESPGRKTKHTISWDEKGLHLNSVLEKRVREWSFPPLPQVYIPAGRALYSFLPPASALRFLSLGRPRLRWPGYIPTFYETLADAIDQLWKDQEGGKQPAIFAKTKFLQKRIDEIFKGQIQYGPDTILLKVGQQRLRPETIAAGQMEIWPFWAILQTSFKAGTDIPRIYFEEPEAHLHPGAQRNVMEIIAYLVGQGGQFVITTHSPYILYAINNFLMAQKVLDKERTLPAQIYSDIALRSEQVSAYRFSSDGTVHDIMDGEVGLIDENELDQVADELGATFTRLQERMEDTE